MDQPGGLGDGQTLDSGLVGWWPPCAGDRMSHPRRQRHHRRRGGSEHPRLVRLRLVAPLLGRVGLLSAHSEGLEAMVGAGGVSGVNLLELGVLGVRVILAGRGDETGLQLFL